MAEVNVTTTGARVPSAHLVTGPPLVSGPLLFVVDSGRLFAIDSDLREALAMSARFGDDQRARALMAGAGLLAAPRPTAALPKRVSVNTISLAIASTCNLGCTYCYASQGTFGTIERPMDDEVARNSIDRLIDGAGLTDSVRVTFLGGEPLANRAALQAATAYALEQAVAKDLRVAFSLTTNGTLLTAADADFLDEHRFDVTISIDGIGATHDAQRPFKDGRGSFARVMERIAPLLTKPARRATLTARVSVTPANLCLHDTLTGLVDLGFDKVQFSPVLVSPTGHGEMGRRELELMLTQMIACGRIFEERLVGGQILPFANMIGTLRRIHEPVPDEYPCGAGGSYLGVAADGEMFACHRFVGKRSARLGDVATGVDSDAQETWLASRNLRFQVPCTTCWARHLCGGGCHYEVDQRDRPACDYIRGWLDYCLGAYARLLETCTTKLNVILGSGLNQDPESDCDCEGEGGREFGGEDHGGLRSDESH